MHKSFSKLLILHSLHFAFGHKHILLLFESIKEPLGHSEIQFPKYKYFESMHVKQFV